MAGVNKVILVGHLGKDVSLSYTQQSNMAVGRFSLATTEKFKGEEKTEWHNIVTFGKTAEIANQYLHKGKQIYLEGRIQTRKWKDKDGNERYTTEIIAQNIQMLGKKDGGESSNQGAHSQQSDAAMESDMPF